MPNNELESHPFLNIQQQSVGYNGAMIGKMIVGTFPIYCLTNSTPIEQIGHNYRNNWMDSAHFQYFYGSQKNYLWKLLSNCFNLPFPETVYDCLELLNGQGIFITDCIFIAERRGYSSSDKDLIIEDYNHQIQNYLEEMPNLTTIIFTSDFAKHLFCEIINIPNENRIQNLNFLNRQISLKTLPTPAGHGRTVRHFINNYPLTPEESFFRANGMQYAPQYRQRLYCETLI